jgi:hypothetical protein
MLNTLNIKKFLAMGVIAVVAVLLSASSCDEGSARQADEAASEQILADLQKAQPVPKFNYSQYRQNLIEVVTAQAEPTPTTTFFFIPGVANPIHICSSVGFAIPSTAQLTNPQQVDVSSGGSWAVTLPQVEPTGVFTGDSTATYAICSDSAGQGYGAGWEGLVFTVTGPAIWDGDSVELIGTPTANFTTGD